MGPLFSTTDSAPTPLVPRETKPGGGVAGITQSACLVKMVSEGGPDLFRVFDGLTSIRPWLVFSSTLSLMFPSIGALVAMGLSLVLRGFQEPIFPLCCQAIPCLDLFVLLALDFSVFFQDPYYFTGFLCFSACIVVNSGLLSAHR